MTCVRRVPELSYDSELREEHPMTTKCAHPPCNCQVSKDGQYGKYCSEHCKEARGMTELRCDCHHTSCGGH